MTDTPAMRWRRMIRRSGMRGYPMRSGTEPEAAFRDFLEGELRQALLARGPESSTASVFVLAVLLFTYGRLDMVDLIVSTSPPANTHLHAFLGILRDLLPLPQAIDPFDGPAVARWVREHEDTLQWDGAAGVFRGGPAPT